MMYPFGIDALRLAADPDPWHTVSFASLNGNRDATANAEAALQQLSVESRDESCRVDVDIDNVEHNVLP